MAPKRFLPLSTFHKNGLALSSKSLACGLQLFLNPNALVDTSKSS